MPAKLCHYLKADGSSCQSPALRGEKYCCHHVRFKGHPVRIRRGRRSDAPDPILVPPPKDLRELNVRLWRVGQGILRGEIDHARARRVLYECERIGAKLRAALSAEMPKEHQRVAKMEEDELFVAELREKRHVRLTNKSFGIKIDL